MTFPILFPQYAKSSMDSSTKIPRNIITVSRAMQKSNTTGKFHYISNSVFKRNSHLCWSVEAMPSFIAYDGKRFAEKIGSVHYHHCVQRWETLQMHNLKKSLGILDYALRVFSKGFPIHEIILNISTLLHPVHCVSLYKIAAKDQVSTRLTPN